MTGLLAAPPASAALCREIAFEGARYTICDIAPAEEALRLYLSAPSGRPYGQFGALEAARGPMAFAMNAGMYHADRRPVGLYIEDGVELAPLVTSAGPGNFGLLPNGVLCLSDDRARVIETRAYEADPPECRFATQSGPMLVIDGALHPRFIPDSPSRHVRNGVGTSADGRRAVFAISARPVSFHAFARLFRDGLGLPNALYLDGSISRLHAPALGRSDPGARMGPIVAVPAR
nr:phosphodiester glycosidase family protein [Wenxinia saemankumensis]